MSTRPTVLVVEPIPIFRELAALSLASLAHVVTAADDETALAMLRAHPPQLVVAHYPPSGPESASICHGVKRSPSLAHIPVILVTSGHQPEHYTAAVRAGADDVLTKPIDRVSLLRAARRLLDGPEVRGLPRVELDAPVRLLHQGVEAWGTARNLSRGGIFVEVDQAYPPNAELRLEFPLPGRRAVLEFTAAVVWVRIPMRSARRGMGLRFLGLDGESARSLEYYVHENRGAAPPPVLLEASR